MKIHNPEGIQYDVVINALRLPPSTFQYIQIHVLHLLLLRYKIFVILAGDTRRKCVLTHTVIGEKINQNSLRGSLKWFLQYCGRTATF